MPKSSSKDFTVGIFSIDWAWQEKCVHKRFLLLSQYTIHGKVTIFNAKVASSCFLFFSLDLLLEDEISASLRDLRRFLMRIPFILSLDFFHSGLGSVVQNLVFAFPLSSGAKIFHTKFLPQHVSESIFFVKL